MNIKLSTIADFLSLELNGNDQDISNLTIDSRNVKNGDLFVAITGKRYDGHDYIHESIKKGAVAILCSDKFDSSNINVSHIICKNTLDSLGIIASCYKKFIGSPFTIGITGTNGKTTVTKLTAEILRQSFSVSTTIGNYNNDIGLPLSILQSSNKNHQRCIYELGASKKNDIYRLVNICEPDMTALLNVSEAHMESFGSFKNLLSTKEEIFYHPNTKKVVLNMDDKFYDKWIEINKSKIITTISTKKTADYFLEKNEESFVHISTPKGKIEISKSDLFGLLEINLLYSIALAMEAGASIQSVKDGVRNFSGVKGRFYSFVSSNKSLIIDDSYNANPESMKSSLNQLRYSDKNIIFIMGDMGELGEKSLFHHLSIFKLAKTIGVKYLLYMGEYTNEAKSTFGDGCTTFDDIMQLINHARNVSDETCVVLIKASRFMNFDRIVEGLK